MKLRRLLNALHAFDFRQDLLQRTSVVEQLKCSPRAPLGEHLQAFVANALTAYLVNLWREFADSSKRAGVNLIAKAGSKANSPKHAQLVFRKSLARVADGTDDFALQIFATAHIVEHFLCDRIKQQTIDGEVAALNIHSCIPAEFHLIRMAAVSVAAIAAKGRNSDGIVFASAIRTIARDGNEHDSKLLANRIGLRKQPHDVLGQRGGGYVIIGGLTTEHQIAHASPNQISRMPCLTQFTHNARGLLRFVRRKQLVISKWHVSISYLVFRTYLINSFVSGHDLSAQRSSRSERGCEVVPSGLQAA